MKYYGKYKAFVRDTNDPLKRGRVKVECPRIAKDYLTDWAEICTPFSFANGGFHFELVKGEVVWLEFEEGDIDSPIISGCAWASNEAPLTGSQGKRVIITPSGHTLDFDDSGKTLTIKDCNNNTITLDTSGIKVADKSGNTLTMKASSVDLVATSNLNLKASNLSIEAGNVGIKCSSMSVD